MSDNFAILESSVIRSSIWKEDAETCKLWITILALKNKDGEVHSSVDGLAHDARISEEKVLEAMAKFLAPELKSRSQEHGGRRLAVIPRGWLVLGHARIVKEFAAKKKLIRDAAWARKKRESLKNGKQKHEQEKSCQQNHSETEPGNRHVDDDMRSH